MTGTCLECRLNDDDSHTVNTSAYSTYFLLRTVHHFCLSGNFLMVAANQSFGMVCIDLQTLLCKSYVLFSGWYGA
jgi:hypothetical protein